MSPYRIAAGKAPRESQSRCCGVCDPSVGGCVFGVRFETRDGLGRKSTFGAGISRYATSTPPLVFNGEKWVEESLSTVGRK